MFAKISFHNSAESPNTTVRIGKECKNMKKTRFWIAVCLLVTVFTFTGCGEEDKNNDAIPDNQQNQTTQQDVGNNGAGDVRDETDKAANDVREDADDLGDDIKDGVDDAADDVKDALDGDDNGNDKNKNRTDETKNDTKQ